MLKVCEGSWLLVYEVERLAPESYWVVLVVGGMMGTVVAEMDKNLKKVNNENIEK